jgi:hypothetical protein
MKMFSVNSLSVCGAGVTPIGLLDKLIIFRCLKIMFVHLALLSSSAKRLHHIVK